MAEYNRQVESNANTYLSQLSDKNPPTEDQQKLLKWHRGRVLNACHWENDPSKQRSWEELATRIENAQSFGGTQKTDKE